YATDNVVQRPDIQGFVGALQGKADSGVFITTSRFSEGARTYADAVPTRVILIDGNRLARLMIRYGVGVQVHETFMAIEIDVDFFALDARSLARPVCVLNSPESTSPSGTPRCSSATAGTAPRPPRGTRRTPPARSVLRHPRPSASASARPRRRDSCACR